MFFFNNNDKRKSFKTFIIIKFDLNTRQVRSKLYEVKPSLPVKGIKLLEQLFLI